jgi:N-acetylglucosamine kinase-like BadF-type ATPase
VGSYRHDPGVTQGEAPHAAVLAVDGGNSKADLALVAGDGTLLAAVRGPSISHQAVGLERGLATLSELARQAWGAAGGDPGSVGTLPLAEIGLYSLAGADYPEDVRLLTGGIEGLGLARSTEVVNDTFGALRAGTQRPWGVVLICGQGINGAAIAPDGRTARFDGVGEYSGDWGGGGGIGAAALAAAVRGRDGRGPRTALERAVPAHFGVRSPAALTKAFYLRQIPFRRVEELSPFVFRTAAEGDAVARSIVDRLADELVAMAGALIRRLRLGRLDPEVVLAGGVFRTDVVAFHERITAGILERAPRASIVRLAAPPVLGAALLGLDRLAEPGVLDRSEDTRLRATLTAWRP